jgi:hypothetical protein
MPLTLAHPVAAIPLQRFMGRWGNLSALVIGSMVPDFHYLLPLGITRANTHSWLGLFWFCVPMGLITFGLFHCICKAPLTLLLPRQVQAHLRNVKAPRPNGLLFLAAIICSLAIGSLTHLLWDDFTHKGGVFVYALPSLQTPLFAVARFPVNSLFLLQHGSSVLGCLVLTLMWRRWRRNIRATVSPEIPALPTGTPMAVGLMAIATLVAALICEVRDISSEGELIGAWQIKEMLLKMLGGEVLFALCYCAAWQILSLRDGWRRGVR